MDYQFLTEQDKFKGVQNRVQQLEQEHFSALLFARETQLLQQDASEWIKKLQNLEMLIDDYRKQLSGESTEEEQNDESEDSEETAK